MTPTRRPAPPQTDVGRIDQAVAGVVDELLAERARLDEARARAARPTLRAVHAPELRAEAPPPLFVPPSTDRDAA
jgi:hypothetical protein